MTALFVLGRRFPAPRACQRGREAFYAGLAAGGERDEGTGNTGAERPRKDPAKKINRVPYSGISTSEDYKPVMQRWSSQRQRYRPCPDAPGWPAISSCSPGARKPLQKNKSCVVLWHHSE